MPLRNPIPGTSRARNDGGYDADSGLDILVPVGTPCYAVADGRIIYSEHGHTTWVNPPDTPNSVLIQLDHPFDYQGHRVNFAWYTHLSSLAQAIPDGSMPVPIRAGDLVGKTGLGNQVPHLHLGLVEDRAQTRTMPQELIAQLIWDQAPPTPQPPPVPGKIRLQFWAHPGANRLRLPQGLEPGDYQLLATGGDAAGGVWLDIGRIPAPPSTATSPLAPP